MDERAAQAQPTPAGVRLDMLEAAERAAADSIAKEAAVGDHSFALRRRDEDAEPVAEPCRFHVAVALHLAFAKDAVATRFVIAQVAFDLQVDRGCGMRRKAGDTETKAARELLAWRAQLLRC
jgi:hypothetical protein